MVESGASFSVVHSAGGRRSDACSGGGGCSNLFCDNATTSDDDEDEFVCGREWPLPPLSPLAAPSARNPQPTLDISQSSIILHPEIPVRVISASEWQGRRGWRWRNNGTKYCHSTRTNAPSSSLRPPAQIRMHTYLITTYIAQRTNCDAVDRNVVP